MRQLTRLLRYVAPYWWQFLSSVLLMAGVGLLDAFRVLLIGPIFDRVLNPASPGAANAVVPGSLERSHHLSAASLFLPTSKTPGRWWRSPWSRPRF